MTMTISNENEILVNGIFRGTMKGYGFFMPDHDESETPDEVFIPLKKRKDAFDLDYVTVKIVKKKTRDNKAEGEIVKVIKRGITEVIGTFKKGKSGGTVIPDDKKIFAVFDIQREHTKGAKDNAKVVISITDYGTKGFPKGRVKEILGDSDDPKTDFKTVVKQFNIIPEFSLEVKNESDAIPVVLPEDEISRRADHRNDMIVTIDGADAKDLDDAVSVVRKGTGYELSVHIADVSHYVREGSALDESALHRGTSVYLINKVVPMLPEKLSNGVCSLNAGEDRFALSCIMEIDENGKITGHRIEESVINVTRRMCYDEVSRIIEEPQKYRDEYGALTDMFLLMKELSDKLRANRKDRGAIDFDFEECKVILDENDAPTEIKPYDRNAASKIIEDFMLAANETVAEDYFWQELPFLYRTHESPDEEKIQKLALFVKNYGLMIKGNKSDIHPREIQKLLETVKEHDAGEMIERIVLRSMRQARYSTECEGHFGLSAKYYCHFTSPIRRYPDLQIHRIIKENLKGLLDTDRINHYNNILPDVADMTSASERNAETAERELVKMKHCEFMEMHLGEAFEGVISGVSNRGIYVELPNTVEGIVKVEDLKDDYYVFDRETNSLCGEKRHKVYALGQKLFVVADSVDKIERITILNVIGEKRFRTMTETQMSKEE